MDIGKVTENMSDLFEMDVHELESEIITLQNDIFVKARANEEIFGYICRKKNIQICENVLKFYIRVVVQHIYANQHFHI